MNARKLLHSLSLGAGLIVAGACSTKEAKAPTGTPTTPVPPVAPVTFSITITSSANQMIAGENEPATLTITARRTDNGQPPPNLTKVQITTTLGSFGNVGGPQSIERELLSGQTQVAFFPGTVVGTATIRAAIGDSVGFASIEIRQRDAFFLSAVSPNVGTPLGGDQVTITGGGFSDPIRVLFGSIPAQVLSATATQIRVVTPALVTSLSQCGTNPSVCNQTVNVSVTINLNETGQDTDSLPNAFSYSNGGGGQILQPIIFSVTPSTGPNEGGTQVTINGDGFDAPVKVEFGLGFNFVESTVLSVTRTRIVVLSPPATSFGQGNLNQAVDIRVTNLNSGRSATAQRAFRYGVPVLITAISPGQGPWFGGDLVTIFGQGFDAPVAVTMGSMAQQVLSVSGTEIVVRTVPVVTTTCTDVTGPTQVVNIESGNGASNGPIYRYRVTPPSLFSVSPTTLPQVGGVFLTINGADFAGTPTVNVVLGGQGYTAPITSVTSTVITAVSPSFPPEALCSGQCDDDNDTVQGTRCLPKTANLEVVIPATTCKATLNGALLITPTVSCLND